MEIKSIIARIKKSPTTIHIKGYRYLKKKILSKRQFKEPDITGITLNDTHLFNEDVSPEAKHEADLILRGEYDLLGKIYTILEINWHKDFNSEKEWEKKYWTEIEYDNEGDKKIPWELNKCQHFVTLGLAYRQTKDKKYFEEYKKQFISWIKENPYPLGINWVTPMECAIRSVNWIEAYHLFKDEYNDEPRNILIKQLYIHGKHIRENMEWSPIKENHYLSDCMGLFFIGNSLKNCKEAEQWKTFAQKELEKEILLQVSQDGVDNEASLNYHRLVTEILLLCNIIGEKTTPFSSTYKKRLENMCEFIMYYTSPTGKAPSFGDTDNGRVFDIWDKDVNDHRDLLSIASVLFRRGDFKAKGKFHERMQLLITKKDYLTTPIEDKELESKSFTHWYIMRDADIFLMIHCGNIGRKGFGGHGHNDQLSFVFSTKEQDYIVDLGTYTYTSDKTKRHFFRSTSAHNSIVLNGKEQNEITEEKPFDMNEKTKSLCFQWQSDKYQDVFIGKHSGYIPNILTREIHYGKTNKEITITERTKEDATMELNFFFEPFIQIKQKGTQVFLGKEIEITCEVPGTIETVPFSKKYGQLSETKSLKIKKEGNNLVTKIKLNTNCRNIF